ncbi:MAG TPA: thioredoxin [Acidimicrobiales bacterium]|jgi:putative thioredoxin
MAIDVTDATFQTEVIERSASVPVVIDLWAPWCGPCRTLGPILERVTDATNGQVVLVKVNVDENPQVAAAFRAQSIPAVYALKDGQVVDSFIGAHPEDAVTQFVASLMPTEDEQRIARLLELGDEASLRQVLDTEPGHPEAVVALAELLVDAGRSEEALSLLARVPETDAVRLVAARARLAEVSVNGAEPGAIDDDYDDKLTALLAQVRDDDAARQEFVDILEVMGPEDPRTAHYRRQLTSHLF